MNDGAGRFREIASAVGGQLDLDSRAIAYADLFNTGSLDLIVANQHGPVKVYRNHVRTDNRWVSFKLEGEQSNKSAIGAVVRIHWDGKEHKKVIHGGDAFSSQSQRTVHFGLGHHDQIDKVEIYWPSGNLQVIEKPEVNRLHLIKENIAG